MQFTRKDPIDGKSRVQLSIIPRKGAIPQEMRPTSGHPLSSSNETGETLAPDARLLKLSDVRHRRFSDRHQSVNTASVIMTTHITLVKY